MKIFPGDKELKAHAQLSSNAWCEVFDLFFVENIEDSDQLAFDEAI